MAALLAALSFTGYFPSKGTTTGTGDLATAKSVTATDPVESAAPTGYRYMEIERPSLPVLPQGYAIMPYGIEIGTVAEQDALVPLWREFLTHHAALIAGLEPRGVLAPDKKWRLIAGPFADAQDAEQACALFKRASSPCETTVYAGFAL